MIVAAVFRYHADASLADTHRPAHRVYLTQLLDSGKLVSAGPFTDGSGALIVYQAEGFAEAEEIIRADPFHSSGVFQSWTLHPWKPAFNNHSLLPHRPT